jgi:ATP-dependent RNA helicase DDX55/SPB4
VVRSVSLENFWINCAASEKVIQLSRIIQHEISANGSTRFIVYFSTCAMVSYFYHILPLLLANNDCAFQSLHGHLPPAKRTLTLSRFVQHPSTTISPAVLLCTDVAARGLDLPDVDVVVQFDPPIDPKQFSHRAGRTARAGKKGRAWVLLSGREADYVGEWYLKYILC